MILSEPPPHRPDPLEHSGIVEILQRYHVSVGETHFGEGFEHLVYRAAGLLAVGLRMLAPLVQAVFDRFRDLPVVHGGECLDQVSAVAATHMPPLISGPGIEAVGGFTK